MTPVDDRLRRAFYAALLAAAAGGLAGALPAAAEGCACYCNKAYPGADPECGTLLRLNEQMVRIQKKSGLTTELSLLEVAECPTPPPASACAPSAQPGGQPASLKQSPPQAAPQRVSPGGAPEPQVPPAPPPEGEFGIAGSNTLGEKLIPELLRAYAGASGWRLEGQGCLPGQPLRLTAANGRALVVRCEAHGSNTAFPALIAGTADLGMKSFPVTPQEAAAFPYPMDVPPQETVVALDGLLIFVARSNPVAALSTEEIARIFAGEIRDWQQLGGAPGPINLYARDEKSGTRETFDFRVMTPWGRKISPRAQLKESSSELAAAVARDPRGIGFTGYAFGGAAGVKVLNIREECGIVHAPSAFEIKTEDYPLARRLYLYRPQKVHSVHAHRFADFVLSQNAQSVIESAGYIGQDIELASPAETHARLLKAGTASVHERDLESDPAVLQHARALGAHARRLSVTFRFRPASSTLDTKAWQDVVRLAHYLTGREPRRQVLLVGFADAQGPWSYNLQLSEQRAAEVKRQLLRTGVGLSPQRLLTRALSELMPVSCNSRGEGREKNRRVEVWLIEDDFMRGDFLRGATLPENSTTKDFAAAPRF